MHVHDNTVYFYPRIGDILLAINDESVVGMDEKTAESRLKALPRGLFRLTVMAPPKNVTGGESSSNKLENAAVSPSTTLRESKTATSTETDKSIITATLHCSTGSSLGFQIEGGSDTDLNYVYIKGLNVNSPALNCGQFNQGDQLVMVGDICLIGATHREAQEILQAAPSTVQVVAQRKLQIFDQHSQLKSPRKRSLPESDEDSRHEEHAANSNNDLKSATDGQSVKENGTAVKSSEPCGTVLITTPSSEDLFEDSVEDLPKIRHTDSYLQMRRVGAISEDSMTFEVERAPGERLGIKLVGGIDNPHQQHVHVSC